MYIQHLSECWVLQEVDDYRALLSLMLDQRFRLTPRPALAEFAFPGKHT